MLAALWSLNGCETTRNMQGRAEWIGAKVGLPAGGYSEAVKIYNARIDKIDQLWARADMQVTWQEEGEKKAEDLDGHLLLRRPGQTAIAMGKLGQTMLWAGCDEQRYWWLDLRQKDERIGYVGRHENVDQAAQVGLLAVQVQPRDVMALLGVVTLSGEKEMAEGQGQVKAAGEYWVLEPADKLLRIWIKPSEGVAVRVDLLDEDGTEKITAYLSNHQPVHLHKKSGTAQQAISAEDQGSMLAREIEIVLRQSQEQGRLKLKLRDVSDGRDDDRIQEKVFDFNSLRKVYRLKRVIDLDVAP